MEPAVLEQAVALGDGGEGLTGAGGHLDQGTAVLLLGQGVLDAADGSDLGRPQRFGQQHGHVLDVGTPGGGLGGLLGVSDPPGQGLGSGKAEVGPGGGGYIRW